MRQARAILGLAFVAALPLCLASATGAAAAAPVPACATGPVSAGAVVYGTPCDDRIVAPPSATKVEGGGGNDTIVAAAVAGEADCGGGCHLDIGSQTFEGGPGDDVVYGERGNDRLYGGAGNDRLYGGIGDDLLRGGPGDDLLSGGFGADAIDGEEGNDYVRGDATQDEIVDRGGGVDTLSYSTGIAPGFFESGLEFEAELPPGRGERGLYLDLSADPASENGDNGIAPLGGGVDRVEGADFEVVIGTPFADYIVAGPGGETIYGGGGDDVIVGGAGQDSLHGGPGDDHLHGGPGDALDQGSAAAREPGEVEVGKMTAADSTVQLYLLGSDEGDEILASYEPGPPARVRFALEAGSQAPFDAAALPGSGCEAKGTDAVSCPLPAPLDSLMIAGLGGDDALRAVGFPDSASVLISGGEGSDSAIGGEEEDVLVDGSDEGSSGGDLLEAGGGDDALTNNDGKDVLRGGSGNDLLLSNSLCDDDLIDGGGERDNASWNKLGTSVEARLDASTAGEPGSSAAPKCDAGSLDRLQAVEDLEGTRFGDVFYGDAAENQLLGWAGEDEYSAEGGADRILANSGDFDPRIECGEGEDAALIDFPLLQPHDVAAPDCERIQESPVNVFRLETELEVPPQAAPTPAPTAAPSPSPTGHLPRASGPSCLGVLRSRPAGARVRCAIRPRRLQLAGHGVVRRLRWRRWRSGGARGFGRLSAWGRRGRSSAPAKLVLSRSKACQGRRWYTRVRVLYGTRYRNAYLRDGAAPTPCTARLRRDDHGRGQRR